MTDARWEQVKLWLDRVHTAGPEDRRALLESLEPSVRKELESLFGAHEDQSFPELTPSRNFNLKPLSPPKRIGPYRILRPVGEGGMGVVYEAEQEKPVRRRVALKLVKWGMDTKAVVARFDSERQALALMNHPNIASVYDAGATPAGRPYFAMEYVQGIPITEYCDKHRLSVKDRLRLFILVCEGVQHAHQKGIIHRDIKPSNVLVAVWDGKPVPKIIDFGVAKATSQRLTEHTIATELGQLIGTPEYMSPEQAEMSNLDIDTRTDVYSLGVLLYELLVGAQPFDATELRKAGLTEIRRRLREDEPPRPSVRLTGLGEASKTSAANRRTEVRFLKRQLKGELDWIALKTLEKDRTRRYETANALALDIERFLNSEPVRARGHSAGYEFRKFVSRHRLATAALVLLLALAGLIAFQERRTAREAMRANREADSARRVSDLLESMFLTADPYESLSMDVTARELLDRGAERIRDEASTEPEIRTRLLATIGSVYRSLGAYDQAEAILQEALEASKTLDENEREALGRLHYEIGYLARELGNLEKAERHHRLSVDIRRRALGERHLDVAYSLEGLAYVLILRRDLQTAQALLEEAIELRESIEETPSPELAEALDGLATAMLLRPDISPDERRQGIALARRALEMREAMFGERHLRVAYSMNNLGAWLHRAGEVAEPEALLQEALNLKREILGERHPSVANTLSYLALVELDRGNVDEATELAQEAVDIREENLPPQHWRIAKARSILGACLGRTASPSIQAETLLREGYDALRRQWGPADIESLEAKSRLKRFYEEHGRAAEAHLIDVEPNTAPMLSGSSQY